MAYKLNLRSLNGKITSIKALVVDATLTIGGAAADAKVVGDALQQLDTSLKETLRAQLSPHLKDTDNPHKVTKSQVDLGNVDNTADADKPVSTAQAKAIADAKRAGTDAMVEAKKKVVKTNAVVALTVAAWNENLQTVKVAGVTEDNTIIAGAAPESYIPYAEGNVRCSGQGDGTLTFQCDDVPEEDLTVNIMILD